MSNDGYLFELPPADPIAAEKKFRERNPIWTGCKAKLIERYLFYFVQITRHGTYIDGFAGPQETDKPEMWSAKLVLESRPRWLKNFYLFDIEPAQCHLLQQMWKTQPPRNKEKREPKRTVRIYEGDFNEKLYEMLQKSPVPDKEATFCLLDQRTFECDWNSVKTLAAHKQGGNKIELFYFFSEGWINRSIAAIKNDKDQRLCKWWGNSEWEHLLKMHTCLRGQFVADRFKRELGYKYAYPFPIYELEGGGGRVMYYMVHASDHDEAPMLMSRAYGKALDIKETQEQLDLMIEALPGT